MKNETIRVYKEELLIIKHERGNRLQSTLTLLTLNDFINLLLEKTKKYKYSKKKRLLKKNKKFDLKLLSATCDPVLQRDPLSVRARRTAVGKEAGVNQ